jgi:peptidyl-tRNA hydrolase
MPPLHVVGMRLEIGPGQEVRVVVLRVEVLRLHEVGEHDCGDGAGKLAVLVVHVLGDLAEAVHEFVAVGSDRALDLRAVLPGTATCGIVGPAASELPLDEGVSMAESAGDPG